MSMGSYNMTLDQEIITNFLISLQGQFVTKIIAVMVLSDILLHKSPSQTNFLILFAKYISKLYLSTTYLPTSNFFSESGVGIAKDFDRICNGFVDPRPNLLEALVLCLLNFLIQSRLKSYI